MSYWLIYIILYIFCHLIISNRIVLFFSKVCRNQPGVYLCIGAHIWGRVLFWGIIKLNMMNFFTEFASFFSDWMLVLILRWNFLFKDLNSSEIYFVNLIRLVINITFPFIYCLVWCIFRKLKQHLWAFAFFV